MEEPIRPEQIKAFRAMTPQQKVEMVAKLWYAAREMKAAYLRDIHPDWSEAEVQEAVRQYCLRART